MPLQVLTRRSNENVQVAIVRLSNDQVQVAIVVRMAQTKINGHYMDTGLFRHKKSIRRAP